MTVRGNSGALSSRERELRRRVLEQVQEQGLSLDSDLVVRPHNYGKEQIRRIHSASRGELLQAERPFVQQWLPRLAKFFASGSDVDPATVDPRPVVVGDDPEQVALFRLACLWWSVPVSCGFGRRFRVLVFDRSNDKLFGLLAMTDPVFNLRARDAWIGWDVRQRERRLAHVMDACVLGAVPPYNQLLGGKFLALLAASDFTRNVFRRRYRASQSVILQREFDGRLAMVTVTSALGRSSVYNRLRYDGVEVFRRVGFTEGYGHFHLANGTFNMLREYLVSIGDDEVNRYKFGSGPNYRIRVVRKALKHLGLPVNLLQHGIRRAVYVAPLAKNSAAFLAENNERLFWYRRPLAEIAAFWRDRWLLPRASRDPSYRSFERDTWERITGM